jgi:AbrB family looped-hinge helix DNA binding protein
MADTRTFDSTISREGRATVPAPVRRALGVRPGDVIHFVVDGDDVRVVTGRALTVEMWSKNHAADSGDAADAVRQARDADAESASDRWAAMEAAEPDGRSDEEVEAAILAELEP